MHELVLHPSLPAGQSCTWHLFTLCGSPCLQCRDTILPYTEHCHSYTCQYDQQMHLLDSTAGAAHVA